MTTRRKFLSMIGLGAPAAAVASQLPEAQPTFRFVGTERNTGDAVIPKPSDPIVATRYTYDEQDGFQARPVRASEWYADNAAERAKQLRDDIEWAALHPDKRGKPWLD